MRRWDAEAGAYVDVKSVRRRNENGLVVDAQSVRVWDGGAWREVWPRRLVLYQAGDSSKIETYRIKNGVALESGVKTKDGLDLTKYYHICIKYNCLINRSDNSHMVLGYKTATGIRWKGLEYTGGVIQQERIKIDAGLEYVRIAYAENTGYNRDKVIIGNDKIEITETAYGSIYIYKLWLES